MLPALLVFGGPWYLCQGWLFCRGGIKCVCTHRETHTQVAVALIYHFLPSTWIANITVSYCFPHPCVYLFSLHYIKDRYSYQSQHSRVTPYKYNIKLPYFHDYSLSHQKGIVPPKVGYLQKKTAPLLVTTSAQSIFKINYPPFPTFPEAAAAPLLLTTLQFGQSH